MVDARNRMLKGAPPSDESDEAAAQGAADRPTSPAQIKANPMTRRRQDSQTMSHAHPGKVPFGHLQANSEPDDEPGPSDTVDVGGTGASGGHATASTAQLSQSEKERRWNDEDRFDYQARTTVADTYRRLNQLIGQWQGKALHRGISWDMISRSEQKRFNAWAPEAKRYVETKGLNIFHKFIKAWVWRVVWEELLAPEAPEDKWRGRAWKALAKSHNLLREPLAHEPRDSLLARWYRQALSTTGRLTYREHGSHTDPERLKRRMLSRFRGCLKGLDDPGRVEGEEIMSELAANAMHLDFCKHFSACPMELEWSDPFTGKPYGFPARLRYENGVEAMEGHWFHLVHDFEDYQGHDVEVICSPFLRVYGQMANGGTNEPPIVDRLDEFYALVPQVMVNCPRLT